ncbi:hypothetical protein EDD41_0410 [Luteococcus japonicus]|uniref:Uncharacterized protein n=1 Tax=Luteococcus japonicus TaxID=33984 RepID=A0A3N1ZQX2_9ACTN|nr:hypothetical protein [Luteococcus japonicus]ROR53275.1 hypothetical protein EDD41_0410 [Luteococcus japonicus]
MAARDSRPGFERPYEEADRAAIRRLIHQIDEDPKFLDKIYNRMVADLIQKQMASHWYAAAADYERNGDRYTAAACRVHAHVLKDGNLLDDEIADDMLIYRAAPTPLPDIAPMRDELLDMIEGELEARHV